MLKVFLAEDEIVMREGIKNNIDWQGEGFEFVGDAGDGELAYPIIQKTRPDILITDIKMPFMDGLELSRLVKHELPETKIIFLSGYDEFQYAKEAIDIGITDYLVKPVTGAQLIGTLKKIGQKIEEERGKQKQQAPEEARSAGRQRLFRHMVSGKHTYASVFQEAKELGLELIAEQYNIMLLQLFSEEKEDVLPEKIKAFEQELEKYMEQSGNLIVAKQSRAEYDFVLKGTGQQSLAETTEQVKSLLAEYFRRETAVEYVAALGTPVERFSELQQCYRQTNLCFSRRYSVERNQILEEETPGETAAEVLEDVKLGELNISSLSQRQAEAFLYTGTREEVSGFVEDYFAQLGDGNVKSIFLRQYVVMDLYVTAVSVLEKSGYKSRDLVERCGDAKEMVAYLTTVEQTREYIKKLFSAVLDLRSEAVDGKYDGIMQKAKTYINDHFEKAGISLNMGAAEVNLSPSHFSTVFGQEMGETFVEYLTRIRMEKAKELLRTTGKKVTEIAFEVGYRDAHYFSNLFKKTQGCTPGEYRSRG